MFAEIGPLTFAFTGDGNVGQGAREVFNLLPHELVSAADLPKATANPVHNRLLGTFLGLDDLVQLEQAGPSKPVDFKHYIAYPAM